jgi:thymidylate synthase
MRDYVKEGIQQISEMPAMPAGDPFALIDRLLAIENRLRSGEALDAAAEVDVPYWADFVRLLQVFWAREWAGKDYAQRLRELRAELFSPSYRPYVDGRLNLQARSPTQ